MSFTKILPEDLQRTFKVGLGSCKIAKLSQYVPDVVKTNRNLGMI